MLNLQNICQGILKAGTFLDILPFVPFIIMGTRNKCFCKTSK